MRIQRSCNNLFSQVLGTKFRQGRLLDTLHKGPWILEAATSMHRGGFLLSDMFFLNGESRRNETEREEKPSLGACQDMELLSCFDSSCNHFLPEFA